MHDGPNEMQRYARQLILPEVGRAGQDKLAQARVLCIGAGGLGSPVLMYLASAGVGHLGIVEHDRVDLSNLQRQIIHGTPDVGRPKGESARDTIHRLNPAVDVVWHPERLNAANALSIIKGYDVVVDCTDNFAARFLTNDACVMLGKPNIYGAIFRFEGQASVFAPFRGGPCYRCLYPEPPPPGAAPSCAEAGVIGFMPGLVGCVQAAEAVKWILGVGSSLMGRLLVVDALSMKFRELKLRRDPNCPVCGARPTITTLQEESTVCATSRPDVCSAMHDDEVSVQDMKRALEDASLNILVVDVREPEEHAIAHVEGTRLLPLSQMAQRCQELDPAQTIYLHCKSGGRSMRTVQFLKQQGFKNVKSVRGGIDAWAQFVDPRVPRY